MPSHAVVEGAIDRVTLELLDIVPIENLFPTANSTHKGREDAIKTACEMCLILPQKTIALVLDLNGHTIPQLEEEIKDCARTTWGSEPSKQDRYWQYRGSRIRLVPAGLNTHPVIFGKFGFTKFSIDDYLVCLLQDQPSYEALLASSNNLPRLEKGHADVLAIIESLMTTLAAQGVKIDCSKRYLDLARAIIGFGGARGTFAEVLLRKAKAEIREQVFAELKADIATD